MKAALAWIVVSLPFGFAPLALAQPPRQAGEMKPAGLTLADRINATPLTPEQKLSVREAIAMHEYEAAETVLVNAINANSHSPELLIAAANVFLVDGKPLNTAIALKKAERLHELSQPDRFTLAMAYIGMGKGGWAKPELERLAAGDPKQSKYPYWLARIEYDEHNYASSVARLQAVTAADPQFLKAWDNLGLSLEGLGKLPEAVASYRRANLLNREAAVKSPWPALNLGTLLTRMGTLEEGRVYLQESIALDSTLALPHCRMGTNLRRDHQDDAAIEELKRCAALDEKNPEPFYLLGQIYWNQGREKLADEAYSRFQSLKDKVRPPEKASEESNEK